MKFFKNAKNVIFETLKLSSPSSQLGYEATESDVTAIISDYDGKFKGGRFYVNYKREL